MHISADSLRTGILTQDLEQPELLFKALGAKLAVGMPFKDIATSDSILLREVPAADDSAARRALRRLAVRFAKPCLKSGSRFLRAPPQIPNRHVIGL